MRIVVNTPNGHIGRALTERLLDAGADVVLISRKPAAVADFAARGARVVEGSIDDLRVLGSALEGADALFWLTPPAHRPDGVAWGRSTAEAAASAVKRFDVRRVVVLSSIGAHSGPGTGPVSALLDVENAMRAAAPNVVVLRPGFLMENLLRDVSSIVKSGAIYSPIPTDKALPFVASADVAARAAAFLLDDAWSGHRIVGVQGPADLSQATIAEVLTRVLGRPVRHVLTTVEQTRQGVLAAGMPDFIANAYAEMFQAVLDGRLDPAERRSHETTTNTTLAAFATSTLVPAVLAASGIAPVDATLASRVNAIMTAWEHGATDAYRAACAPGVRMTIPAYKLDVSGFDSIWGVRTSMKALDKGPLDIHTLTSHAIEGRSVRAVSHVISRATGQFTQHANVRFDFDDAGRLVHYHQDVVWAAG